MTQPPVDPPQEPNVDPEEEPIGGSLTPGPEDNPPPPPASDSPPPPPPPPPSDNQPPTPPPPPPPASDFPPPPAGSYPPPPAAGAGNAYPPPPPPPPAGSGYPAAPPEGVYPPAFPPGPGGAYGATSLKPHRGTLVLALGIIGLLCCGPVSIVAFLFGKKDMDEMDAGLMDPSGRGTTNVGRILGIVGMVFFALSLVYVFVSLLTLGN